MSKMRLIALFFAGLLGALQTAPASAAQFFNVTISGTLTGTQTFFDCIPIFGCTPSNVTPFSGDFGFQTYMLLSEGPNPFDYGYYLSTGEYSGTIIDTAGVLSIDSLSYYYQSFSGDPHPGSYIIQARGTSLNIAGGVPEPTTWAMLLIGFGGIAIALRRKQAGISVEVGS